MVKVIIDDREVEIPEGYTVLQAAEKAGVEIPVFCYHPKLPIAGNCRMCLVDIEKMPKPVASCAQPVADGMIVRTTTTRVTKARKGVLEFLLINHPLDCPICDQGGECDLQDITMSYGPSTSRFEENKRSVGEKKIGPLIKTFMNRCIHCTRCIRFSTEIAGVPELGATGRGETMEVGTYIEKAISSELSGNLVDICPVGALTSKPYAFKGRSWELEKTESIDVMDAVGSNIRIDSRGTEVMRILPRANDVINEDWISDKARYACDALKRQRLDRPYVRVNGKLQEATWEQAFHAIKERLKKSSGQKIAALAGDLCDVESMMALKDLMASLGSTNIDCRQDGAHLIPDVRASYLFNTTIADIEKADVCLLIGVNPRIEAPLINARLRKTYLNSDLIVASIGCEDLDLTYPVMHLGSSPIELENLVNRSNTPFYKTLANAKNPMLIVGQGALIRKDGLAILSAARSLAEKCNMVRDDWNGFNVLHTAAGRVGGLDIGFVPDKNGLNRDQILSACHSGSIDTLFLLGADELPMRELGNAFVIYQGHHGDAGAHRADVILPGAAYTEKNATYVNTEGRVQHTHMAVFPPGEAKEDWKVIRALSESLGKTLSFDTLQQLRHRMAKQNPIFARSDVVEKADWKSFGRASPLSNKVFEPYIENFYMTDVISRHSPTMAKCVEEILKINALKVAS